MFMKIYTWNVNGFNACNQKLGFSDVIKDSPDFICLQEIKLSYPNDLITFETMAYECYYSLSTRKGRNGVAVFSRTKPINIFYSINFKDFDNDGRFVMLEYPDYILINVYMPHGGRAKENIDYKLESYKRLIKYMKRHVQKKCILVGDFNIAHTQLDAKRAKQNVNNTMFTEEERAIFTELLSIGLVDTYREQHIEKQEYTWWPYAFSARERNIGWRIDYILASKSIDKKNYEVTIHKEIHGSDHCPISLNLRSFT